MLRKKFVPMTLAALLLASPLVTAEEAHHPEQGAAAAEKTVPTGEAAAMPAGVGGTEADPQGEDNSQTGSATGPGMMMGSPGGGMMPMMMKGVQQGQGGGMMMGRGMGKGGGMGMMRQGMMGGMQDDDGGQGGMMGRGGMMGMMHGGKGGGMMGHGGHGQAMAEKYHTLIGRLDLLEARMAKIEIMLERLLQR